MRRAFHVGFGSAIALLVMLVLSNSASACHGCGQPCVTYTTVEKTIMVPTTVYQKKVIQCLEYRPVVRECTVNVTRRVPVTKQVKQICTVMVPKVMVRQEAYTVARPVYTKKQYEVTIMVPRNIVKQGVRQVCKYVPTKVMNTVTEDHGCWVTDKSGCCTHWQPNIVQKQVACTVMKPVTVDEPFQYTVTVCEPKKQIVEKTFCHYEYDKKVRNVQYTVCEPKQVERTVNVTTFHCVTEPQVRKYTQMVAHPVQKEISVPICQMVPKVITCKVPVYACK